MTDIVRDPYGNPLNRDNLITALRAEVASKDRQFQEYARKMEADMNALAAQNEKLRAALHGVIRVADRKTAEFDEARAALEETKHECL